MKNLKKIITLFIVFTLILGTAGSLTNAEELPFAETVSYNITYCYNGDNGFVSETLQVPEGEAVISYLPTPQVTGKVFQYWVDENKNMVDETTVAHEGMFISAVLTVAVHEHTVVAIGEGKEATCTETGLTAGEKCSECGEIIEEQQEIPLKEHTSVPIPELAPTQTEPGHTGGTKCSMCQAILTEPTVVPATGNEDVTYTITYCYNDPDLVTGTVSVKKGQPILEMLPEVKVEGKEFLHWITEDKTVVTADTVAEGNLFVSAVLQIAQGHVHMPVTVEGKEPTCTETGITTGSVCGECGAILTASEVIPAKGHTEEILPAVAATETSTGLTEGKKCSLCGVILLEQEVIPMLTPSTGHYHKLIFVDALAPTASSNGNVAYFKCEGCGKLFVDAEASVEISADSVVLEATGTEQTEKPSDETEKPSDETEKTSDETEKPSDEIKDPSYETEKPAKETEKNDNTSGKETAKTAVDSAASPNTGDDTNLFIWLLAMLISGGMLFFVRRKNAHS